MTRAQPPEVHFSHMIPAQPGYHVIAVGVDRQDFPASVFRRPVIAWAIEVDSYFPFPITPGGVETDYSPCECPNGLVVESAGNEFFENVAEWLASEQLAYARARNMSVEALVTLRRQVEIDRAKTKEPSA